MEGFLRRELATTTLKAFGSGGGGCISNGQSYITDSGKVFVKVNTKAEARRMFDGESASLSAIIATKTVRVPQPVKVLDHPEGSGSVFIMEHVDMKGLSRFQARLGYEVARLHLHNEELRNRENKAASSVHVEGEPRHEPRFGFHTTTCCGYIPQDNTWEVDWVTFFTRHKLQQQMDLIEKDYGDREALTLWAELQHKIPAFFKDVDIKPSLLHGDLWGGNVAETSDEPVIFDPASFYGHHEFELGIATMFGGFSPEFFDSYHSLIPRMPGFRNRNKLYKLFNYLNHWNHFGSGYRGQSISVMKDLIKS